MSDWIDKMIAELVEEAANHRESNNSVLELRSLQKLQAYSALAVMIELRKLNAANAPRTYVGDEILEDIPLT